MPDQLFAGPRQTARGEAVADGAGDARAPSGRVLLTGATGFLGSALLRVFSAAGYDVHALVRKESPRDLLTVDATPVLGDLRDAASLERAMRGVDILVHAAADYRLWARDPAELYAANVEGTRLVLEAAVAGGVKRIVYTSSVAVLKPGTLERPSTEDDLQVPEQAIGPYKRSKAMAEAVARRMAEAGAPIVIVAPSTPIGPRDIKPTPTGRVIVEAARGRMPAFVDTGLNLAHVDDIAAGHLLALRRGAIGGRYILGGKNVMLADMLAEIARCSGRRAPKVKLPVTGLMPLAALAEGAAKLTGRAPFVSFDALRMARKPMFFDDGKARRELGYTSRPWQEAIGDALDWFGQRGMLA